MDYRRFNKVVVREHQVMPFIKNVLNQIEAETVFFAINLKKEYFYMRIEEKSKKYTAFAIP